MTAPASPGVATPNPVASVTVTPNRRTSRPVTVLPTVTQAASGRNANPARTGESPRMVCSSDVTR
ncbi:MAG TPA: hypothetical protein VHW06_08795 [Streptosporangiaceae bacterium]|jgi:hypothetical protein|nr:hypothetical protein [Streptosporangiaceae bacterium]